MFRKIVGAVFVMVVAIGFVVADEYTAQIVGVNKDGTEVTLQKTKKGKADGEAFKMAVAKDAVVKKGTFNKDTKKVEPGDAIEGGLKADVFQKATADKGVTVRVTTDADNKKVTTVLLTQKKKKAAE